jgi:hypothetical protein
MEPTDDEDIGYTMDELLEIDRAMHALSRVAVIMGTKFNTDDGLYLVTRATYALLMEQFAQGTNVEEFKAIEARLRDEENIILKPMRTGTA